jgi:hypothetical protein
MRAASSPRTATARFARQRSALATARRRGLIRDDSDTRWGDFSLRMGDGTHRLSPDVIALRTELQRRFPGVCVWCDSGVPARDRRDGRGREHVVGTNAHPDSADTYVCHAPDPETGFYLHDDYAEGGDVHPAPTSSPDYDAYRRVPGAAGRALRVFRGRHPLCDTTSDDDVAGESVGS